MVSACHVVPVAVAGGLDHDGRSGRGRTGERGVRSEPVPPGPERHGEEHVLPNPYLQGNFRPVSEERSDDHELPVTGVIPPDLDGPAAPQRAQSGGRPG